MIAQSGEGLGGGAAAIEVRREPTIQPRLLCRKRIKA
jgi:hypothetical protein